MCEHGECQEILAAELWSEGLVFTDPSEMLVEETVFPSAIEYVGVEEIVDYDSDDGVFPYCNEGYSDIGKALYEKNREEQVRTNFKMFEEWNKEGRLQEATLLATWLYEQHVEYGDIYDAKILEILKDIAEGYRADVSHTFDSYKEPTTYFYFE